MSDVVCNATTDSPASRAIGRRTVLAGAASALLGIVLTRPAQAGTHPATPAARTDEPFDPTLARRLQQTLDDVVAAANGVVPGRSCTSSAPATAAGRVRPGSVKSTQTSPCARTIASAPAAS